MMCITIWQQAQGAITVPDDIAIWGNLSLAMVFNLLVTVLRTLGFIKDDTATKKFLGGFLAAAGAMVGLVFALTTHITDLIQIVTLSAGGALAGIGSVGLHSTWKNIKEGLQLKTAKK